MHPFPSLSVSRALATFAAALSAVAFSTSTARSQLNPGDILISNNITLNSLAVLRYNAAGVLVQTFTGTNTLYNGAGITPNGNIVTTFRKPTAGFTIFSPVTGTVVASFNTPETNFPGDVSVFADGTLAIGDGTNGNILLFDQSGNLVRTISGGMKDPFGSAVSPLDNTLWVADTGKNFVFHFDEAGTLLGSFPAGFSDGGDLVVDPTDGSLWVTDIVGNNIFHLSPAGATLGSFHVTVTGDFLFGVGITSNGSTLYTTTAFSTTVNRFDRLGHLLGSFDTPFGTGPLFLTVVPSTVGTPAAPEPASLALLALAGLPVVGLVTRRRR